MKFEEKKEFLISIVVPIFNADKYLEKCITSIQNQTYRNIEIILVDDGSTDSSSKICDFFVQQDSRIKKINQKNCGVINARKKGIELAKGKYVGFVDADDWIDEEYIERFYVNIQKRNADMIHAPNFYRWYESGKEMIIKTFDKNYYQYWMEDEIETLVIPYIKFMSQNHQFTTTMWSWMIDINLANECIKKINKNMKILEDTCFIVCCLLNANSVACIDSVGYHYRDTVLSLSKTKGNAKESIRLLYEILSKEIQKSSKYNSLNKLLNSFINNYIMLYIDEINVDPFFLYSKKLKGSRILVYGAGFIGKKIVKSIENSNDYELVEWVDQQYEELKKQGYRVSPPQIISSVEYDYIIIAVTYKNMYEQIKEGLLKIGVSIDKIVEKKEVNFGIEEIFDECNFDR